MLLVLLGLANAQPPNLEGSWKLTYDIVTKNDVPVIGALKSSSRTFVLARITDRDGTWAVTHDVCGSRIDGGIVKSKIPEAYLGKIPSKSYTFEVDERGGSVHLKADTGVFVAGYDPARCDAPPDEPSADCVVDWDGDGNPGATIHAKAPFFPWVEVYVAQRNHLMFDGTLRSDGHVEGKAWLVSMDNRVIGASNKLFARSPKAEVAPEESVFSMSRLSDGASCADVLGTD